MIPKRVGDRALGIVLKNNTVLLQEREDEPMSKYWSGFGGEVLEGETHEDTLKRKSVKEIRINIKVDSLLYETESVYPTLKRDIVMKISMYLCQTSDEPQPNPEEVSQVKWLTSQEAFQVRLMDHIRFKLIPLLLEKGLIS